MAGFKKYDRSKLGRDSDRPERGGFGRKFGGRGGERSGGRFGRRDSDRSRGNFSRDVDHPRYGREEPEKEMFDVICDRCEKECKVPFKPTRGKPVYCSECFSKKEEGESRGGGSSSRDLEEINRKLDKIMRALKID